MAHCCKLLQKACSACMSFERVHPSCILHNHTMTGSCVRAIAWLNGTSDKQQLKTLLQTLLKTSAQQQAYGTVMQVHQTKASCQVHVERKAADQSVTHVSMQGLDPVPSKTVTSLPQAQPSSTVGKPSIATALACTWLHSIQSQISGYSTKSVSLGVKHSIPRWALTPG